MEQGHPPTDSFNGATNPYKAQRLWPPDFSKMDSRHQFRLEKKYKRRAKLAYTRPRWQRGVRLVQYTSIVAVLSYSVFWMDWGTMHEPFSEVREWARQKASSFWSVTTTQPPRPNLGRIGSNDDRE